MKVSKETHHPRNRTGSRIPRFHAGDKTIGTDLSGSYQCLPSSYLLFQHPHPKYFLSGFRSRCHIVVKGAFPEFRVRQGLDQLIHVYTLAGFPNEELHTISSQILIQHQNLQTHEQNCWSS